MSESYRETMARIMKPQRSWDQRALGPSLGTSLTSAIVHPEDEYFGVDRYKLQEAEYAQFLQTSSSVYTCIRKRAVTAKSLDLKFYRKGQRKNPVFESAPEALFTSVNPFWTFGRLMEATEQDLCTWGEAFWVLVRDGKNLLAPPREIWRARPDRMHIVPSESDYIKGFIYVPEKYADPIFFDRREVVWIRYPHPTEEFAGLSPLSSARITIQTAQAAMSSNQQLFTNGMQIAGIIRPRGEKTQITKTQAEEIIADLDLRFSGKNKKHRWAVFRFDAEFEPLSVSPKDAEFMGLINWSLTDVANVFGVPQDLVGGQRTYENVNAAMKAFWMFTMKPELQMIAEEITEQVLPLFAGGPELAEFDFTEVEVLQEDKQIAWTIAKEQMTTGVLTQDEYRESKGLKKTAWGSVWWAPVSLVPIRDDGDIESLLPSERPDPVEIGDKSKEKELGSGADKEEGRWFRTIDFGSAEHHRYMLMFARRTAPHIERFEQLVGNLFRRQTESVLSRLNEDEGALRSVLAARSAEAVTLDPFDKAVWVKRFLQESRPVFRANIEGIANEALTDIGLDGSFNVDAPDARRFLEQRAQRFATRVNDTTYRELQETLSAGIGSHETIEQLSTRVKTTMGDRIKSSASTIARTEVIGASNGGTVEAWRQSGAVETKRWLAALDSRTRADHIAAHGQEVPLDANFIVGGFEGPFLVASGWAGRTSIVDAR